MSFPEAVEELAQRAGLEVPRDERAGDQSRDKAARRCTDCCSPRRAFYRSS